MERDNWHSPYDGYTGARAWARWMLAQDNLAILDTETTGLEWNSEVVSVAAVDREGNTLLDVRVQPVVPIPSATIWYHGIRNADLQAAPSFEGVYRQVLDLFLRHQVVIYNASYDLARLDYSARLYGLPAFPHDAPCAMEAYAAYYGNWSDYHHSFRWQKLATAAGRYGYTYHEHNAREDCLATLVVMQNMARGK